MSQPAPTAISSSIPWTGLPATSPRLEGEKELEDPSLNHTNQELVTTIVRLARSLERRERELEAKEEEAAKLRRRVEELEEKLGEVEKEADRKVASMEEEGQGKEAETLAEASREKAKHKEQVDALMKTIDDLRRPPTKGSYAAVARRYIPPSPSRSEASATGFSQPTTPSSSSWSESFHRSFLKQNSPTGSEFPSESVEQMKQAYEQQIVDLSDRLSECHAQLKACATGAQVKGSDSMVKLVGLEESVKDRTSERIERSIRNSWRCENGTQSQPASPFFQKLV